jgi:ferritin-like metal-binding protein YciE
MSMQSLEDLLGHEIGDLLSAEQQLVEGLPQMAKAATAQKLKQTILDHLQKTRKQLQRLEKVAEILELKSSDKKTCKAMKSLIAEGEEIIKKVPSGPVRDAAIIASAQRIEHYEMAAYGSARAFAQLLEETDIVRLLSETYKEELAADQLLSRLAEGLVNQAALEAGQ